MSMIIWSEEYDCEIVVPTKDDTVSEQQEET